MTRDTLSLRTYGMSAAHTPASFDRGPAWMTDPARACAPWRGDADLFTSERPSLQNRAAKLCRDRCPFVAECDAWACANKEPYGVWGARIRSPQGVRDIEDDAPATTVSYHQFTTYAREQQAEIVQEGLESGLTYPQLAQRWHMSITQLQIIVGHAGPTFDEEVQQKFRAGVSDKRMARDLGVTQRTIATTRARLGLIRPAGRPMGARDRQARRLARDKQLTAVAS